MVRALQIIILLPLIQSKMPANTGMFLNQIAKIAAFDFLPIDDFVYDKLELIPTDPVNEKFEMLGIETLFFINNMGSFIILIFLKLFQVMVWIILTPF